MVFILSLKVLSYLDKLLQDEVLHLNYNPNLKQNDSLFERYMKVAF